jgi:hypothetical protein
MNIIKSLKETNMNKILSTFVCALSVATFSLAAVAAPAKTPVKTPAKPSSTCNMAYQNCLGVMTGKGPAKPIVQNRCFKEQKFTTNAYGKTQGYFTGKTICI